MVAMLFSMGAAYSQVGVNTTNPQGIFNVDGAKDNSPTGVPTTTEQLNDVVVDATGNLGVGTTAPSQKLDVNGTFIRISGDPLRDGSSSIAAHGTTKRSMFLGDGYVNPTATQSHLKSGVHIGSFDSDVDWVHLYNTGSASLMSLQLGGAIASGKVGINTVPDTDLHVAGSVKIVDGTQGVGKVLTSDANGVATWSSGSYSVTNRTLDTWYQNTSGKPLIFYMSGVTMTGPAGTDWYIDLEMGTGTSAGQFVRYEIAHTSTLGSGIGGCAIIPPGAWYRAVSGPNGSPGINPPTINYLHTMPLW